MRAAGRVALRLLIVAVLSFVLYSSIQSLRRLPPHPNEQAGIFPGFRGLPPPPKEQVSTYIEELQDASDKLVVDYLLKKHLFPPSTLPYNLSSSDPNELKASPLGGYVTVFGKAVDPEVKGFFVEAGANNVEFLSNTLQLETKGWEGLLVEGSPGHFQDLKLKHRKAWIADVCLAGKVKKMTFVKNKMAHESWNDAMRKPFDKEMIPADLTAEAETECFPLGLLLKALNRTRIDFFSLDVDGFEYEVLKDFPFDEIDVRTMVVENTHSPGGHKALADLLIPKGFDMIFQKRPDSYFVKKERGQKSG